MPRLKEEADPRCWTPRSCTSSPATARAPRVLELAGPSIRIGRGTRCEVRLGEPSLAEVQCLLQRRGVSWHIQPVGPPGRIHLGGRPVDQSRPLPLGVPLQVGDAWLTLRSGGVATAPHRPFDTPLPPDPEIVLGTNVPPRNPAC